MKNDWFLKEKFKGNAEELAEKILPMLDGVQWHDSDPSQAPGSKWCKLTLDNELIAQLEAGMGLRVFPEFFVWNYYDVKVLKIHRDENDPGHFRPIVGVLPLVGNFETSVYRRGNFNEPLDSCEYGCGDFLVLNNTKYFHGGRVLSETRISLHFYFDFFPQEGEMLADTLQRNRHAIQST